MRRTIFRCARNAAVLLLLTGTAFVGVAAAAAPTGDPQGVALAKRVVAAYSKISGYTYRSTGFVVMYAVQGKFSVFEWRWGVGTRPRGWVRANERAAVAMRGGHVLWWRDDLIPQNPPCHARICSGSAPVDIVVDRSGAFSAFGSAAHHTCYGRLGGTTPYTFGGPAYTVSGTVAAPVRAGGSTLLRYSYAWGSQTAHETDTVSNATSLVSLAKVSVAAVRGAPAFSFHDNFAYPRSVGRAPRVNLCHR